MRTRGLRHTARGFWMAPAAMGVFLILLGVLIFVRPELLIYTVAAGLIMVGVSLLTAAIGLRGRVTYRRMDGE